MEESTKKFLIVAIAVVAVLSIVACVACVACGSTSNQSNPSTPSYNSGGYAVSTPNPIPTPTPTPTFLGVPLYNVGEVITTTGSTPIQLSVTEVKRGSEAISILRTGENVLLGAKPEAGYEYIMYNVWVKNVGSSKRSIGSYNFQVYANGVETEYSFVLVPNGYHEFTSSSELLPGAETSGWMVDQVPLNADCKLAYEYGFSTKAYVQL